MGNLIVNALNHNPPETTVTVLVNLNQSDKVTVLVFDNGTGISDEEQKQLFERYYRGTNTSEKPEGSGLGWHSQADYYTSWRRYSVNSKPDRVQNL